MSDRKRMQIPAVPQSITDPRVRQFLEAIKNNIEHDQGLYGVGEKRPTVTEMIDAGVTNAENIE